MNEGNLNEIIEQMSKEKNIDKQIVIEALEEAILKAAKKHFGENRDIEAKYNNDIGRVEIFQYMKVVEQITDPFRELSLSDARKVDPGAQIDDELGFQIFYLDGEKEKAQEEDKKYGDILKIKTYRNTFGRIAAKTAKNVIFLKIQEAERLQVYNEYKDRKGELVTGVARRFEKGNVIVDLGKAEAILLLKEQIPRESFRPGDRVQAYLKDVLRDTKGHQLLLSRTDPRFVIKLFEKEVPEIYEGIVKIMAIAREPGERTKIAVNSLDPDVDPVGACVGMKGTRVQAVVQEIRGEKIDIVPYSSDLAKYVCNAIAPAEVQRVLIDESNRQIELILSDAQLSLAIGKKGQNVKLASKLLDWKIEIHSETFIENVKERMRQHFSKIDGIEMPIVEYIFKLGYHSPDNILKMDESDALTIPKMSKEIFEKIQKASSELKQILDEEIKKEKEAVGEHISA